MDRSEVTPEMIRQGYTNSLKSFKNRNHAMPETERRKMMIKPEKGWKIRRTVVKRGHKRLLSQQKRGEG